MNFKVISATEGSAIKVGDKVTISGFSPAPPWSKWKRLKASIAFRWWKMRWAVGDRLIWLGERIGGNGVRWGD